MVARNDTKTAIGNGNSVTMDENDSLSKSASNWFSCFRTPKLSQFFQQSKSMDFSYNVFHTLFSKSTVSASLRNGSRWSKKWRHGSNQLIFDYFGSKFEDARRKSGILNRHNSIWNNLVQIGAKHRPCVLEPTLFY